MPAHCRHCLGDCGGDCLLPGGGERCIHRPAPRLSAGQRLALLRMRSFWHRVFWGIH